MAGYIDLTLTQGDTFNYQISWSDDATGAPINIANYAFQGQLRRSYYSQNVSANIICTIADAANGTLNLSISAGETANLRIASYVYDVKGTIDGTVGRVIKGLAIVEPSVTR